MTITLGTGRQNLVLARNGSHNDTVLDFRSMYFANTLSGSQEAPATAATATGTFTAALNFAHTRFAFTVNLDGIDLDGDQTAAIPDNMTDMHIHGAPAGVSGGVIFGFRNDAETGVNAATGTVTGGWDAADGLTGGNLTALLGEDSYFNIHTSQFPGGAIRGQILAADAGNDRIDLRDVNIGSFSTLQAVTSEVQGDALIRVKFNGALSAIRLDGVGKDDLKAGYFLFGGGGDQVVAGTGKADDLFGGAGGDRLSGGNGADRLWGETGNDTIAAGGGNDTLTGGDGQDRLAGFGGADHFDFNELTESARTSATTDVITDFGIGDRIDLRTIDAKAGIAGNQAFHFIGEDAFFAEGQIRVSETETATIVYINTDGKNGIEMMIKVVGHGIAAGDFLL
ncbi:hypothetical protein BH10PSE7_BH10PSE7_19550 [soil metagenome]